MVLKLVKFSNSFSKYHNNDELDLKLVKHTSVNCMRKIKVIVEFK